MGQKQSVEDNKKQLKVNGETLKANGETLKANTEALEKVLALVTSHHGGGLLSGVAPVAPVTPADPTVPVAPPVAPPVGSDDSASLHLADLENRIQTMVTSLRGTVATVDTTNSLEADLQKCLDGVHSFGVGGEAALFDADGRLVLTHLGREAQMVVIGYPGRVFQAGVVYTIMDTDECFFYFDGDVFPSMYRDGSPQSVVCSVFRRTPPGSGQAAKYSILRNVATTQAWEDVDGECFTGYRVKDASKISQLHTTEFQLTVQVA